MNNKRLIIALLWLGVLPLAYSRDTVPTDSVSSIVLPQDTMPQDTATQDTVVYQQGQMDYEWSDLRSTRDSMRYEMRYTRAMYRRHVKSIRDSVRSELYAEILSMPHEIRVGCGDALFENLCWHENPHPQILPESYSAVYNEHYRYTQHIFLEYLYNVSYWYSIGAMVDYSGVLWDEVTRNGLGVETNRVEDKNFNNIVFMPVVRFSYWHANYVSLYSSLGLGVNINTGSEIDYKGRQTAIAVAANITLLGVRIGNKHFFGSLELGGMYSLAGLNEVYMLGSRIFTASLGYRF